MADAWFRARRPGEGTGYGVANRKGVIASVAFVLVTNASAVLPPLMTRGSAYSLILGAVLVVAETAAFLWLVRRRSDWRG